METLVIDASIAIKWLVEEEGTPDAVRLRLRFRFVAPELLVAECANILWKKVQRLELMQDEAILASRLLERAGIELISMRGMIEPATTLALELGHPAYDGVYLALARQRRLRFVTADQRLLRVVAERASKELAQLCVSLQDLGSRSP